MEFKRVTQANIEVEQLLLGAIIANNEIYNQVGDFLLPEHFYEEIHKKIYASIDRILEKGISASVISISSILQNDPQFIALGAREYLANLAMSAITGINAFEQAKIIYDLAVKRQLITIGEDMIVDTYESSIDIASSEIMEKAESKIFALASTGAAEKSFRKISESVEESLKSISRVMKNSEHTSGITSGFVDLDNKLFGFHNSDLVILAARPSMGKTSFALNLAVNACRSLYQKNFDNPNPPSVGFFSLEMSSEQLATRLLSMYSNIDAKDLRTGKLNESDYNKLRTQAEELASLPLFIDDTGSLSISALRTRARRLKRKNNLAILFIDYLQLMNGSLKTDNRVLEISEITQGLKALAKELNIPIVVLSQLSRAVESREDKRPMLSDLRDSGAIEQDADVVMFIYRDEYYLSRKEPGSGTDKHSEWQEKLNTVHNQAEIIVAKHRNGPIGNVTLYYDATHSKFSNLDKIHT